MKYTAVCFTAGARDQQPNSRIPVSVGRHWADGYIRGFCIQCPMMQLVIRFVIGGLAVCAFALLGEVLRPKTFAGLFAAAPSVALATLTLTLLANGKHYAAIEARSMAVG